MLTSSADSRATAGSASAPDDVQCAAVPRINRPIVAMGHTFSNALGLAAGIDRTGRRLASLVETGAGHVEVGTVTDAKDVVVDRASLPAGFRVGVNFASPRSGMDAPVIDDYAALLRALWTRADYLVANLSSPSAGRTGDAPGVERLIERLASVRGALARDTGCSRPLLVKTHAGALGTPLPRAIAAAKQLGFQGIVLVTSSAGRLSECCGALGPVDVISVGDIATAGDASVRFVAGAKLVQIHTAFVDQGPAAVRGLLGQIAEQGGKS